MKFRFILQPVIATFLAIKAGVSDAKAGRTPYFWSLFTEPDERRKHIREGWKSVSKVFVLAIVLDLVYQWVTSHRFYPGQALVVATTLAILPYLVFRGAVTRFMGLSGRNRKPD